MNKLALFFSVLLLTSCCAMFNGRYDDLTIDSNITSASVSVNGVEQAKTPCVIKVKRTDNQIIRVSKEGYETKQVYVSTTPSGWLIGDVALCCILFPVPLIVDLCAGTWADIEPDIVHVNMLPNGYKRK